MTAIKKGILAFSFLMLFVLLTACSFLSPVDPAPAEESAGIVGGDTAVGEDVNLSDITVSKQGEDTVIELSFISGSRMSNVPESKLSNVPQYSVSMLPAPYRLKVDIQVAFTDYEGKTDLSQSALLYGIFQSKQKDSGMVSVYFQLSENVTAQTKQDESKLVITLTPEETPDIVSYFAGIDAFDAYEQNRTPGQYGLSPTLCADLNSVILVSEPQPSQVDADQLIDEINNSIAEIDSDNTAYSFSLEGAALPQAPMNEPVSVAEDPVFEAQDMPGKLETLVKNGKYLCDLPDGGIVYSRAYLPASGQDTEQVLKERLWTVDADGIHRELPLQDFYSIEKAGASPDGKYLAVLDAGMVDRLLYVCEFDTGELHNLGEEGFGDNTTSFVWDDKRDVLYAMTGYGTLQLTQYDFSKPEGEQISSVEEQNGADSKIAIADRKIYFADETAGEIYAVDIESAERETIAEGIDFAVSGDGRYLASLVAVPTDEEALMFNLMLTDLFTRAEPVPIVENIMLEKGDYAFGADPNTFYYTTTTYDGVSEEYPFAFLKYSIPDDVATVGNGAEGITEIPKGAIEFLGYFKTGKFVPGQKEGEVYIIDYFMQNNNNFSITYLYREE